MTRSDVIRLVTAYVDPISPLLYQDMAAAIISAEGRVGDLARLGNLHLRPLTVRAELRHQLEDQALGGWILGGDPRLMGELYLSHPGAGIILRVLKERRKSYPGGVPVAGSNASRRHYWSQPAIPGIPGRTDGQDADSIKLLLLWDLVDANDIDAGFVLRMVRTLGPGKYGTAVPVDFSVDMTPAGGSWEFLKFSGDEEPEEFFRIRPDEETGETDVQAV